MNSIRSYRYRVVDVFTEKPLEGNSLAVFPDASHVEEVWMQRIARELNLSETVFVFPATRPDCAARVRIFTPAKEMIFAGHPTIGTAFVLLEEGMVAKNAERFALEEKVGPVTVRVESGVRPLIWLSTPPVKYGRCFDRALSAQVLGVDVNDLLDAPPQFLSAGNPTIFVALKNRDAVDRAHLDLEGVRTLKGPRAEELCVVVFTPTPDGAYTRMFAPEYGIAEDPATGSSTGPLALFMIHHGLVSGDAGKRFVSEQGTKMGRRSILHVHVLGANGVDGVEVGGHVTNVAEATMKL